MYEFTVPFSTIIHLLYVIHKYVS